MNHAPDNPTPPTVDTISVPSRAHRIAGRHLLILESAVRALHLNVRYEPGGSAPPRLTVINPNATQLQEVILAAPVRSGTNEDWYFWWSWADRIGHVEHTEEAARKIAHVLRDIGKA